MTIKQIHNTETSDSDNFKLDGEPLTQLTFVGLIRNVAPQTTMYTYTLDDGTGTIEVKMWNDADKSGFGDDGSSEDTSKVALAKDTYARVFGHVRSFNDKRMVNARSLRPVTDHNEVQTHLLEATVVHLHNTRGPPGGANGGAQKNGASGGDTAMGGMGGAGTNGAGGKALPAGLSQAARRVYGCLKTNPQSNEGLHAQQIASDLGMSPSEVERAGAELVDMALTYSTVDEQTWAVLDDI